MQVSVIIPVFNAERFLPQAIQSALTQEEVREVLLIDDGSKDGSLETALMYARNQPLRIRVLRHPGGANRGPAATRNLGIAHARSEFISFLDADDIYIPFRFKHTSQMFTDHPEADGVYETVLTTSLEPGAPDEIDPRAGMVVAGFDTLVQPDALFQTLAAGTSGYVHLDGLVLRSSAFTPDLYFDDQLRQSEDTDFVFRWAAKRRLLGTSADEVVAYRRIHDHNTVFNTDESLRFRYQCMRKCALHAFYGSRDKEANWQILNRMARASNLVRFVRKWRVPVTPFRLFVIGAFLVPRPKLIRHLL